MTRHDGAIHAYVLMTNRVHLLMTPATRGAIGKVMQSLGRQYVRYFNHADRRTGTLWEGRFRSTVIDIEAYLLTCMRYIELNPVRAGMVAHPVKYPWSSYWGNTMGVADGLLSPDEEYQALGAEGDGAGGIPSAVRPSDRSGDHRSTTRGHEQGMGAGG